MSRLTKKQALEMFGRNLPTPTIEKMTIENVKDDDEIFVDLDVVAAYDFGEVGFDTSELAGRAATITSADVSRFTRVILDISFYLQTWDDFDVNELTQELFEDITTSPDDLGTADTSNSLYINAALATPPGLSAGDQVSDDLRRKTKLDLLQTFASTQDRNDLSAYERIDPSSGVSYDNFAAINALYGPLSPDSAGGSESLTQQNEYEVSLPLSQFYEAAQLTALYDKDDNPIIKVSNIQLSFYITDFSSYSNVVLYAAISSANPLSIASRTPLDAVSFSMNFGDVTYEDLVTDGTINSVGEPVFVDASGTYYPNLPLRSINKKYYKIDEYGPRQIVSQMYEFLKEYDNLRMGDEELLKATDDIKYQIVTQSDSVNFLDIMNKSAQIFSETNKVTRVSRFFERLRILIKNADATLRNQEEVVKRVYRNYKVIDARSYETPEFDSVSYLIDIDSSDDYIYRPVFYSTVANYVPISDQTSDWPGKAELPTPPSGLAEARNNRLTEIQKEIARLMIPSSTTGGMDGTYTDGGTLNSIFQYGGKTGRTNSSGPVGVAMPAYTSEDVGFTNGEIMDMLRSEYNMTNPIHRGIMRMAWWSYNDWAGRFVRQCEHKAYRANPDFDGKQWWVGAHMVNSEEWDKKGIRSKSSDWNEIGRRNKGWRPPYRWRILCQAASPAENDWELIPDGIEIRSGGDDNKPTHGNWYKLPKNYGQKNKQWCIDQFGFDPTGFGNNTSRTMQMPHSYYTNTGTGNLKHRVPAFWYHFVPKDDIPNVNPYAERGHGGTMGFYPKTDKGYARWYMNPFFWEACSVFELNGLWNLADQDDQISIWVPEASFAGGTKAQNEGITRDDIETPSDASAGTGLTFNMDATTNQMVNISKYWNEVGTVKAIYASRPKYSGGEIINDNDAYDDSGPIGQMVYPAEARIPYIKMYRRKFKKIYDQVFSVVMSALGMDDNGLGQAGGPEEGDGITNPSVGNRIGTNSKTELDEYVQEMPGIVADKVAAEVCEWMDTLPYGHIETNGDRTAYAAQAADIAETLFRNKKAEYAGAGNLTFYMATSYKRGGAIAIEHQYGAASRDTYKYGTVTLASVPYTNENGDQIYLPVGRWGLDKAKFKPGQSSTFDNSYGFVGASGNDVFAYDFSSAIQKQMQNKFNSSKASLKRKFKKYLEARAEYLDTSSDTGIHSTLSSVDIVVCKYGYYWFDMEKYIRKRSKLSKVMNVDRFMRNFPTAKPITNSAIQLHSTKVALQNFGSTRGDPFMTEMPEDARIQLFRDLTEYPHRPTVFDRMTFDGPRRGIADRGQVYAKIPRISEIRFDQISEFTPFNDRGGAMLVGGGMAPYTPSGPGGTTPGGVSSGGGVMGVYDMTTGTRDTVRGDAMVTDYDVGSIAEAERERENALAAASVDLEVDINLVLDEYPAEEVYSNITMRNYVFNGFNTNALPAGQTWINNYRLMCFRYQFFIDDDLTYNNDRHFETMGSDKSVDDVKIEVILKDNSEEVVRALKDIFEDEMVEFTVYYNEAQESCAFDAFDQRFNKFFADAMLENYTAPLESSSGITTAPWFRMAALYVQVYNLFSDEYAGNRTVMEETSKNILETIRPETGTLASLISFYDQCVILGDQLVEIHEEILNVTTGFETSDHDESLMVFNIDATLGSRVVDHIGDYTERSEEMMDYLDKS